MLTDFHGRDNQSFVLWEQRISSKAWALSLIFLSSCCVSPFLAQGDFHARSRFARFTIPVKKRGNTRSLGSSQITLSSQSPLVWLQPVWSPSSLLPYYSEMLLLMRQHLPNVDFQESFVGFHMARDEGLFILDWRQFYRPKNGSVRLDQSE